MRSSTLCIQGPPGAGKTFTGSRAILSLLKQGKRVGITSNSHHAIENLMRGVSKVAKDEGFTVTGYKVSGDDDTFLPDTGFEKSESSDVGRLAGGSNGHFLVGATAWAFSRDDAVGSLDYLFVDEAGQMSLANLVAVSRAPDNIVLMGDQRQLEQPIQGSHPGESGSSCLSYLLRDFATIPPELGIFLGSTYRMRPRVCEFVSSAFYEGRLEPHSKTLETSLILSETARIVTRSEGILFIESEHEDNSQSCQEEAEAIKAIVEELMASEVTEKGQKRAMTYSDILAVAPFNLQVKLLKRTLPDGIAVGSVGKFQGKEAPVVILSMCLSSLEEATRGVEFLFSPNRLNVALSRAKCLAIVVGNPALASTAAGTVDKMRMVNLFCKVAAEV